MFFYHSIERLLICGGEMEMELVDGGEELWDFAFKFVFVFFFCVWLQSTLVMEQSLWKIRIKGLLC